MKPEHVTIQIDPNEQYFHVVLFMFDFLTWFFLVLVDTLAH